MNLIKTTEKLSKQLESTKTIYNIEEMQLNDDNKGPLHDHVNYKPKI